MEAMSTMKDIRIIVKLKNNLILKRGENLFHTKNQADLARKLDMSIQHLGSFINFTRSPVHTFNRNGAGTKIVDGLYWSKIAENVAKKLKCSPWDIFPEHTWEKKYSNRFTIEVSSSELFLSFSDPETKLLSDNSSPLKTLEKEEIKKNIPLVLSTLKEKEEQIIRLMFGLDDGKKRTYTEVASLYNVSKTRIAQIEHRALRKLRRPERRKFLECSN